MRFVPSIAKRKTGTSYLSVKKKIWGDKILVKRSRNINTETGIRRTVGCKNKVQWQKKRKLEFSIKRSGRG
jgi:hypothetical protein